MRNTKNLALNPMITRFAPSPTGYLHLGHVASAIFVWSVARALGAKIILRIEDHDRGRCRRVYEEAILRDLEWLGFEPDEGVNHMGTPSPFRQSDRIYYYEKISRQLIDASQAFYCTCSRKQIGMVETAEAESEERRYPGTCRAKKIAANAQAGLRLRIEEEDFSFDDWWMGTQHQSPAKQCGDMLLRDRQGNFSYQFCVVIDDQEQGVNLIVRGQDLVASTGRQMYLGKILSAQNADTESKKSNIQYFHHPLLTDATGKKLSKRDLADAVATQREDGARAKTVLAAAFAQMGIKELEYRNDLNAAVDYFRERFSK